MKRILKYGLWSVVTLLAVLVLLMARPCAFTRFIVMKSGADVDVEIYDNHGHLLWEVRLDNTVPVRKRVYIEGSIHYVIRAKNLKTGEVMELEDGYDFPHNCHTNLVLIDYNGIHFNEWSTRGFFDTAAMILGDELSCLDARIYNSVLDQFEK